MNLGIISFLFLFHGVAAIQTFFGQPDGDAYLTRDGLVQSQYEIGYFDARQHGGSQSLPVPKPARPQPIVTDVHDRDAASTPASKSIDATPTESPETPLSVLKKLPKFLLSPTDKNRLEASEAPSSDYSADSDLDNEEVEDSEWKAKTMEFLQGGVCTNGIFKGYFHGANHKQPDSLASRFYDNLMKIMGGSSSKFAILSIGSGSGHFENTFRKEFDIPVISTEVDSDDVFGSKSEFLPYEPAAHKQKFGDFEHIWKLDATEKEPCAAMVDGMVEAFSLSGRDRVVIFAGWPDEEAYKKSSRDKKKFLASAMKTFKELGVKKIIVNSFIYYDNPGVEADWPESNSMDGIRNTKTAFRLERSDLSPFFDFSAGSNVDIRPDMYGALRAWDVTQKRMLNVLQSTDSWRPNVVEYVGIHTESDYARMDQLPDIIEHSLGDDARCAVAWKHNTAGEYIVIGNLQAMDLEPALVQERDIITFVTNSSC